MYTIIFIYSGSPKTIYYRCYIENKIKKRDKIQEKEKERNEEKKKIIIVLLLHRSYRSYISL